MNKSFLWDRVETVLEQPQPVRPLSATRLAHFRRCELLFLADHKSDEDTPQQRLGRAAHCLILEGRRVYDSKWTSDGPVNLQTGKPFGLDTKCVQNWEERHGKSVLTPEMGEQVEAMAASVAAHENARQILAAGRPEVRIETVYRDIPCYGFMDWAFAPRLIAELKTVFDIDAFEGEARRLDYPHQMAFYRALMAERDGVRPESIECFFIAVEKEKPYRAGVWNVGQGVLGSAQQQNEAAIERLKECRRTNTWRTGYEEMRSFDWF